MSAAVLSCLLRSPAEIASACREDRDLRAVCATALAAIAAGGAAFGAVVGSFRGGVQILYAGVKVPLAVLLTLALCAPAFHALAATLGRPWPMRTVVALALAAAGRSSLVLLALAPALWLAYDLGLGYHAAALAAAVAYGVAGFAALGVLLRGLGPGAGRALTALGFVALFFAVGGQASWILRPYLVRPRTESPPFLRSREGGFAGSLLTSGRSAAGVYDRDLGDAEPWDTMDDAPAGTGARGEPEADDVERGAGPRALPESDDAPRHDGRTRRAGEDGAL